jgi:hypothetical protein
MTITINNIPASLVGQALLWEATSNLFNPINKDQGKLNRFIGKPIRVVARSVFEFAIKLGLGIPGGVYHFSMSAYYLGKRLLGRVVVVVNDPTLNSILVWEHFKAGIQDIFWPLMEVIIIFFARGLFALPAVAGGCESNPNKSVPKYFSSSKVSLPKFDDDTIFEALLLAYQTMSNEEEKRKLFPSGPPQKIFPIGKYKCPYILRSSYDELVVFNRLRYDTLIYVSLLFREEFGKVPNLKEISSISLRMLFTGELKPERDF